MLGRLCVIGLLAFLMLPASARELDFSGYRWLVRSSDGQLAGPGPNVFSGTADFVSVDVDGKLHLSIRKAAMGWVCSEIVLTQALGYGSYEIEVETNPFDMDRQAVFGFFTYGSSAGNSHSELDVELSYWGKPSGQNAQFVVQPSSNPDNISRFNVNQSNTVYAIHWTKGMAEFTVSAVSGQILHRWVRTENVPDPGDAKIDMNLWLVKGASPQNNRPIDFVVKRFAFTPESGLRRQEESMRSAK